eukprot:7413842-Ditylum_brightwellii.AAC.1
MGETEVKMDKKDHGEEQIQGIGGERYRKEGSNPNEHSSSEYDTKEVENRKDKMDQKDCGEEQNQRICGDKDRKEGSNPKEHSSSE